MIARLLMFAHGVINKESGQVKDAGKPANNKNNMKGFDPEHCANSHCRLYAQLKWLRWAVFLVLGLSCHGNGKNALLF
jgi:hypothetical protein